MDFQHGLCHINFFKKIIDIRIMTKTSNLVLENISKWCTFDDIWIWNIMTCDIKVNLG